MPFLRPPCRQRGLARRKKNSFLMKCATVRAEAIRDVCGLARDPQSGRRKGPENLMGAGVATNPHYPEINRPLPGLSKASQLRRLGLRQGMPWRSPVCAVPMSGGTSALPDAVRILLVFRPKASDAHRLSSRPVDRASRACLAETGLFTSTLSEIVGRCRLTVSAMKQNSHADPSRAKHNRPVDK